VSRVTGVAIGFDPTRRQLNLGESLDGVPAVEGCVAESYTPGWCARHKVRCPCVACGSWFGVVVAVIIVNFWIMNEQVKAPQSK